MVPGNLIRGPEIFKDNLKLNRNMDQKLPSILIVDDSETNLVLLTAVLGEGRWPVRTARSGADALKVMHSWVPDLILLDLLMPGIDGYQMLERLKSDERYSHIPVIVISAVNDPDTRDKCLQKGAVDYLPKPVNIKELETKVKTLLG